MVEFLVFTLSRASCEDFAENMETTNYRQQGMLKRHGASLQDYL